MRKHYPLNSQGAEDAGQLPWTDGNPTTGVEGSYPGQALFTDTEAEVLSAQDLAGLVRSGSDKTQLGQAISRGIYLGGFLGTANALSAALPNGVTIPSLLVGMRFTGIITTPNTGSVTVQINGFGTSPGTLNLLRGDGQALVNGDLPLNRPFDIRFDGSAFRLTSTVASEILALVTNSGQVPVIAKSSYTFYVNGSTGNDNNNGLSQSSAFATMTRAAQVASGYYLNGQSITINVADGTYGRLVLPSITGGKVYFVGNSSTPSNCLLSSTSGSAILGNQIGDYTFTGFKVTTSAAGANDAGAGVQAGNSANITLNNFEFGACYGQWALTSNGATITLGGSIIISGSPGSNQIGFRAQYGGIIQTTLPTSPSLNITTPVTGSSFIQAIFGGNTSVLFSSITNKGNFSGVKYDAEYNGIVNTSGGGANYYPGTSAGGTSTGGQYL